MFLKNKQIEIIKQNKNVKTAQIYNKYKNIFPYTRKVYILKNSLDKGNNLNCSTSSKNPVDHIQGLKELVNSRDKFVRAYSNLAGNLLGFIMYLEEQILDIFH